MPPEHLYAAWVSLVQTRLPWALELAMQALWHRCAGPLGYITP